MWDGMEICHLCPKKTQCPYQQSKRIVLNWQSLTQKTMSIPTIKKTMHGIDILDGMEIGHGMEMCDGMEM